jgi:hypothetical protein
MSTLRTDNLQTTDSLFNIQVKDLARVLYDEVNLLSFIPASEHAAIAAGTSTFNCTSAVVNASVDGRKIYAPKGTYLVEGATASHPIIISGDGPDLTVFKLANSGLNPLFEAPIVHVEYATVTDAGRASLDHTQVIAAFLIKCTNGLKLDNCAIVTDYAVSNQNPVSGYSYAVVQDSTLRRHNAPLPNEAAELNLFVGFGVQRVSFVRNRTYNLVGRSIINYTYTQTVAGVDELVSAAVVDCEFDLFRKTVSPGELKTIFLGGYLTKVKNNLFRDCFGRHIDVLTNYSNGSTLGVVSPNAIHNNKVVYTTANALIQGAANDEPGSIYCRYADVDVRGNYLDYTNLLLTSNTFSAIAMRHGYHSAVAVHNTIISPKAYAITADISDAIDTDNCNVTIASNVIKGHANASRRPINVSSTSLLKTFRNVVVKDNSIGSLYTYGIGIKAGPGRTSPFMADAIHVEDNYHVERDAYDTVEMAGYPANLVSKHLACSVVVDPAGGNTGGTVSTLAAAIATVSKYVVASLEIKLAASVVTTQTFTGPVTVVPKSRKVTFTCDNGNLGRIRMYCPGTAQSGIAFTMTGGEVTIEGGILNSDSAASTTSLIFGTGVGQIILRNCTSRYGRNLVETRGPDVAIAGGTADNFNLGSSAARAILLVQADRLVSASIRNVSGANNTRLYNLITPSLLSYDAISLGTVAGLKTATLVV